MKLHLPARKARKLPYEAEAPMNKMGLVEAYAKEARCTVVEAEEVVETLLEVMARQIVTGRGLRVTGFGSFTVEKVGARWARNPQTGEPVGVPEQNRVSYSAPQRIKDILNGRLKLGRGERIVTKKPKTKKAAPAT